MTDVVIVSGVRTPIGRFQGGFSTLSACQLGSIALKEALRRAGLDTVDEVIMGNVVSAGLGQNPARQAAIGAGIPVDVNSFTVNKVCGSGLKAIMLAAQAIKVGDAEVIAAGGMENMTRAPYMLFKARDGYRLGDGQLVDGMVHDGLWDIYNDFHMGITGEIIAEKFGISREEADTLAFESHQKSIRAQEEGKFKEEIIPVTYETRKGEVTVDTDEGPRKDTSLEVLAKLKPVFKKDGVVTAGNASQISDGASAVVVMSEKKAETLGLEPLARIVDYCAAGLAPELVMEAPIPCVRKLFQKTGKSIKDVDLFEHNEAFATASCAVKKELQVPPDIFNVHGGAVALGHPIGCSGARVLVTLMYAMKHRGAQRGVATLCLGGGNAVGMMIEV
ncbi:MAG: acetyl-CoA C-acetyltransferase [Theionarchaea archaeon]|nr:acetyl-CoA C-acetyltransferase [Theionarchaea archaeon]MBU7001003.1 acetyl-CoA C-acetyltransferase [Theionarchaea archaeon]MBU7021205.1 acetyl-CoA C-acetyltransferase [Theionarchaea archaeon]MBU7036078.1 acetyl-CoA C-acetyltransferase [Theionarchaea archaeon]MBU7041770.1 acetyl-CoA C-acetyltransferase [Theionarchaea archaeon]